MNHTPDFAQAIAQLPQDAGAVRDLLRRDRQNLEQQFLQHGKAARLLQAHCKLIDHYLACIWQQLQMPDQAVLVAVGGYGRGELYPKSDIDLLILLQTDPDESLQQKLQQLIGLLWDIGLEVGHSIRTIAQCMAESVDITVQTNLLEARYLVGCTALFEQLRQEMNAQLDPKDFFLAKQKEQQQRHLRFLDIDFNLEPNLKESPGGLRDLQTISWISQAAGLGTSWAELAKAGLITATEARQISLHNNLLQTLRIRLHYLAKRREDRLIFEFQANLANQLNITAHSSKRASEYLMKRYYRTKMAVRQYNTILLQSLRDYLFRETPPCHPINERFRAYGNLLDIRDEQLFEHQPEAIFELFLLLAQYPDLVDISSKTLRALWRGRNKIDAAFRRNPANRAHFMEIMRLPVGVLHSLRRMNQYGILGRYIPAFGHIVGQMQHDLFHVYTVDEHTLMVVRNLRRFSVAEYIHEVPLCSKLMNEFARPEVLYIAGLFHDIAKGRGGDHSQLGKKDARLFCKQHNINQDDSDLIVWLVEQHLTLSSTAQKQDLSDPDVITQFAKIIPNDRYLVALYLLTVADVRGTSPKVWNAWKGKLFETLFRATRRLMSDGQIADRLGEIRREAETTLNLYAISPDSYQLLWAQLEESYFFDHDAHEIAWHTRLLSHRVNSAAPIVKARLSRVGEGLQVLVYCPDQRGLFARICDFFARMSYNIVEAKIHTSRHGYALNSFQIIEVTRSNTAYRDIMTYIEFELAQQIVAGKPVGPATSGRINRQLKHFPIKTKVDLRSDNKGMFLLSLIAGDRPGLLARLALMLERHNVRLHRAKINTLGSRAEDVFWVSSPTLLEPTKSAELLTELLEKL